MLTSSGTVSAWSELSSPCGAVISRLSLEYRGAHAGNSGEDNLQKGVQMGDVLQAH